VIAALGLPPLRGSEFLSVRTNPVPFVMILAALALYVWGVRRVNARYRRHQWPAAKTWACAAALVVTLLAVTSFVGVYEQELFYDHMVQHLMLIMAAAPLFAMSSPIDLAWRACSPGPRTRLNRILRSRPSQFFAHPLVAFALYAVLVPLTHLTSWFNYTIEQQGVDDVEHLVFLMVGYMFWRHVFGSDPNRFHMHQAAQFLYLFLAVPIDTFTGLALDQAHRELFPAYLAFHRTWGPSLVEDLHIGGVIMWVGGDTLMVLPMIPVAIGWMHLEERRATRADREYEAMAPGVTSLGPYRPPPP
jgi:cytochrome c oxidase assembly factor CtaG